MVVSVPQSMVDLPYHFSCTDHFLYLVILGRACWIHWRSKNKLSEWFDRWVFSFHINLRCLVYCNALWGSLENDVRLKNHDSLTSPAPEVWARLFESLKQAGRLQPQGTCDISTFVGPARFPLQNSASYLSYSKSLPEAHLNLCI